MPNKLLSFSRGGNPPAVLVPADRCSGDYIIWGDIDVATGSNLDELGPSILAGAGRVCIAGIL